MKILQVIPFFTPALGGSVTMSYYLSHWLARAGHEVTIITTDYRYDPEYARSLGNVEVIPFKRTFNLGLFLYSPGIKEWLRSNITKYDVAHLHTFRSYQNAVVATYAKRHGVPYIVQPHGSLPRIVEKEGLKRLYDIVWGDRVLRDAEGVIALTSTEAEQARIQGVNDDQIHIIANGVDLSQYEDVPQQGEFRALYGIPSDARVILSLGRLHPIKGIDLLLRAFETVVKEVENCRLVVAGPDEGSLPGLKTLAKELGLCSNVLFTGPLYGRDKFAAYRDSDIYVLPSYYEAFSLTALEAWAFRKPVIVTEQCGVKDYLLDAGFVIHPDPGELAEALREYLQHESLRRAHGQNGYDRLHTSLSIQATVQNIEALYWEVIKSRGIHPSPGAGRGAE